MASWESARERGPGPMNVCWELSSYGSESPDVRSLESDPGAQWRTHEYQRVTSMIPSLYHSEYSQSWCYHSKEPWELVIRTSLLKSRCNAVPHPYQISSQQLKLFSLQNSYCGP